AGQPPSNNNNNHASEFELKGQWYHAYHNRIVATNAGITTTYKRNLAIETLSFKDDGTIQQVTYTEDGVPQIGSLNPYQRVEAEATNAQSGIETEVCKDGGMDVTALDPGDWIRVRGVDFGTSGAKSFSARVASTKAGGTIEIHLGTMMSGGTLAGTCMVPSTGDAQTFMTTTCDVSGATGMTDVYFIFKGTGSGLFNFDSWQFTSVDGGTGGGGASQGGAAAAGGAATGGTPGGGFGGATATNGGASAGQGGRAPTVGGNASAGTSGSVSSGGSAGTNTAAGSGTLPAQPAASSDDRGGCSCRLVSSPHSGWWSLAMLAALATARRRKRASTEAVR
ncbi:MAG TPA: carbohydrate-binding protein, partial [Polyangiaceae bacterium]|nr:carbohydrate-binding protein [Polyangiaceae bacterium]